MLTKKELDILEEVLNEEILSYLDSGYKLDDEYTVNLRNLLKKLNLKEIYDFDKRYSKEQTKQINFENDKLVDILDILKGKE